MMTKRTKWDDDAMRGLGRLLIVAVIAALVVVGVAVASGGSDSQTCPDGQTLKAHQVNGDKFTETKAVPDGGTITDSVSGEGLDYTQVVDSDSVTLNITGGGPATLTISCR